MSHPAWVCGLKLALQRYEIVCKVVTPCVGVWIETRQTTAEGQPDVVTPCVGVWIETSTNE